MQGIYGIYCKVSGKWYVGQASNMGNRWSVHRYALNSKKRRHPNPHLYHAWCKYGAEAFEFVALEEVLDAAFLTEREEFWIAEKKKLGDVYNVRVAADSNLGMKTSLETRTKQSVAKKGKKLSLEHRAALALAQNTPEVRAAKSAAHRGLKASLETRAKLSASLRKRPPASPETCAKISAAKKGKKLSSEHCAALSAAQFKLGRKMSLANREKLYSPETRAKIVAANRKLSEEQVTQARLLQGAGHTQFEISKMFNVSTATISRALAR